MKVAAVITGIGLVTPLGRSVDATWQALLAGRGIVDHARVDARVAARNFDAISRVSSLGIEAAGQAMAEAKWSGGDERTAVVCCTSKGAVEDWIGTPAAVGDEEQTAMERASLATARRAGLSGQMRAKSPPSGRSLNGGEGEWSAFGLGGFSNDMARHAGLTDGPRLTISAACASGLHALIRAVMMIQSGEVSRVLLVAAEASVHPLFLASFDRLGVLPPAGGLCRPFDVHRQGFLMSDAAAAVCLEAVDASDLPRGLVAIDGFAMGGDATHLTGSDPQGRVLRHLLGKVIGGEPVDLVHAHGTGTVTNDSMELAALESVLPAGPAACVFSHKGAMGHSLGASGLVAVAINCMSHRTGLVPGNINTVVPLPAEKVRIGSGVERRSIRRSVVHAAGFGGPAAVVGLWSGGEVRF